MAERPYIWVENGLDGRRRRWYPDEFLTTMTNMIGSYTVAGGLTRFDPGLLDPEQCRRSLPELKAGLDAVAAFVNMVEQRAKRKEPTTCASCQSRFYPSRSDAKYCGGACRMRAHRRAHGARMD